MNEGEVRMMAVISTVISSPSQIHHVYTYLKCGVCQKGCVHDNVWKWL